MKKIDILNFITDFRKSPNEIKTYDQLVGFVGKDNEETLRQFIAEFQQTRVLRETQLNGEKAYQVIGR